MAGGEASGDSAEYDFTREEPSGCARSSAWAQSGTRPPANDRRAQTLPDFGGCLNGTPPALRSVPCESDGSNARHNIQQNSPKASPPAAIPNYSEHYIDPLFYQTSNLYFTIMKSSNLLTGFPLKCLANILYFAYNSNNR